jgi:hypothetical protein
MKKSGIFILGLLLVPFFASAAVGDIVIQEVLFDPSGADTGLEYIILKNKSSADINMTAWDLYPSGIGYFTFPDFSLSPEETVKVHLRASGVNDAKNLYHEFASSNIRNSSGSIALFSSSEHTKDTIKIFVRYQKVGSSESKTWETAASDAGLWQKGDFVDIGSLIEGQVIFLSDLNDFKSSSGWSIKTSTEEVSIDQAESQSQPSDTDNSSYVQPEDLPQIKAYAGKDRTVTVGADTEFRGQAFGLEDEPLDNARYLWTFGDGASKEGKNITHTYQYPGDYIVALNVSSGDYSASDYLLIKAIPNQIFISEIKTGADSFVEFENKSKEEIDISGCQVKYQSQSFIFPQSTRIRPNAYLVIPSSVSDMIFYDGKGIVEFLYSGGFKADIFNYDGFPSGSESFNRTDSGSPGGKQAPYGVNLIGSASPGAKNSIVAAVSKTISSPEPVKSSAFDNGDVSSTQDSSEISENFSEQGNTDQAANIITVGESSSTESNFMTYLLIVGGLIVFAAAAILFIRRERRI